VGTSHVDLQKNAGDASQICCALSSADRGSSDYGVGPAFVFGRLWERSVSSFAKRSTSA
jgi:hypothetical protein